MSDTAGNLLRNAVLPAPRRAMGKTGNGAMTQGFGPPGRRRLLALGAAVERRREMDRQHEALLAQLHAMGNDRARLAQELDAACARVRDLGDVSQEVTRRLDVAMGTIRDVLATHGG